LGLGRGCGLIKCEGTRRWKRTYAAWGPTASGEEGLGVAAQLRTMPEHSLHSHPHPHQLPTHPQPWRRHHHHIRCLRPRRRDVHERPELCGGTVEFCATPEYWPPLDLNGNVWVLPDSSATFTGFEQQPSLQGVCTRSASPGSNQGQSYCTIRRQSRHTAASQANKHYTAVALTAPITLAPGRPAGGMSPYTCRGMVEVQRIEQLWQVEQVTVQAREIGLQQQQQQQQPHVWYKRVW